MCTQSGREAKEKGLSKAEVDTASEADVQPW